MYKPYVTIQEYKQYKVNTIVNTDSYKFSHFLLYPNGTEYVSSYIESRGGKWDKTVFFGLQMLIKVYLSKPITYKMIKRAKLRAEKHGVPFNEEGWKAIVDEYGGFAPVIIEAVPEGTIVNGKNVLVQIRNTDKRFAWIVSYLETCILRAVWFATTVATNSWQIKQVILKYVADTCDDLGCMGFMLNDFASRGASSAETSILGGIAHLVSFIGTDNFIAYDAANPYYYCETAGFSVIASEHSVSTLYGPGEGEYNYIDRMLGVLETQIKKTNKFVIVAAVSDTYDLFNMVENIIGGHFKERIKNLGVTGRFVVRPDSGDPIEVPVRVVEILLDKFGFTTNSKGFKVLPSYIRVIQGDGVDIVSIEKILQILASKKIAAENICFGSGGALMQKVDRDTLKFAQKASSAMINGAWTPVFKDPKTDPGKQSKKGILVLVKTVDGVYETYPTTDVYNNKFDKSKYVLEGGTVKNHLRKVYENGTFFCDEDLDTIRARTV